MFARVFMSKVAWFPITMLTFSNDWRESKAHPLVGLFPPSPLNKNYFIWSVVQIINRKGNFSGDIHS